MVLRSVPHRSHLFLAEFMYTARAVAAINHAKLQTKCMSSSISLEHFGPRTEPKQSLISKLPDFCFSTQHMLVAIITLRQTAARDFGSKLGRRNCIKCDWS